MQSCFLCFGHCVRKSHKKATIRSRRSYRQYTQIAMITSTSIFFLELPSPHSKNQGGGQDHGGDGSKIQDSWVGGLRKGRYSKDDEEEFYWCGVMCLREEEVPGEVSEWVQKESVLESTRHCDSREYPGGERTWGFRNFWDTRGAIRILEGILSLCLCHDTV